MLRLEAPPPCEVVYEDVPVRLSDAEMSHYDSFRHEMAAQIQGREVTAVSAGALTSKLCAWASGGLYGYDESRVTVRPHTRKREALLELFKRLQFLATGKIGKLFYEIHYCGKSQKAAAKIGKLLKIIHITPCIGATAHPFV